MLKIIYIVGLIYYIEGNLVSLLVKVYKELVCFVIENGLKYIVFLVIFCGVYGYFIEEVVEIFI